MRSRLPGALAALLAAGLVSGCATHYRLNAGSPPVPAGGAVPGTSVSGGAVQVQSGGSGTTVLIAAGVLALISAAQPAAAAAPTLAPARRVNEQDCTRPIEDGGANLKCR